MTRTFLPLLRPSGTVGLAVVALFVLGGVFGPMLVRANPLMTDPAAVLLAPSRVHLIGTDNLGRDAFAGIVWGARTALLVGFLSVGLATVLGVAVGAVVGYFGGVLDEVLVRVIELFIVIPRLFLAMVLVAFFGVSLWIIVTTLALVSWPQVARLVRAEFKALRTKEFVEAAVAVGVSHARVITRHMIPNTLPTLIANASLQVSSAILLEAGLSFFGLSDPNRISWGGMLSNGQQYLLVAFWMPLFPGAALSLVGLGLNLLGDGLTRALSP